ncbi:hypothetical protein EH243_18270 [Amphritea opalescens]|uniref:Uncharacterized protein n=1 Tax=Amphritea opalescens TaxID=2490544 RepID=A0A430KLB1_9GAMM|nr:hypothetical protein [Amphritea opalescens]RTE64269.1 hypothetical protein EH243_18270 [Amphritea opalescens]
MARHHSQGGFIKSRLIGLFASLFFSVPTAILIWFGVNKQLAYFDAGFFSSTYLIACILIFSVLALLFPRLFSSILGGIWRGILKVERWWGW